MLAVQKPPVFFPSAPAHMHRPTHARHPSAPVVIRSTHTPGLLTISKPIQQPARPQQHAQQHTRAPKQPSKGKSQRSPQPAPAQAHPVEDDKKSPQPKQRSAAVSDKVVKSGTSAPSSEKSPRGRQPGKPASKDKATRRSVSVPASFSFITSWTEQWPFCLSAHPSNARRLVAFPTSHPPQGCPPNMTHLL